MREAPGRRVVVTGLGAVSSLGTGARTFGEAIRAGRIGVSRIRGFDTTGFPHAMAGEVHDFAPEHLLRTLDVTQWGRSSLFAASAASLAVDDAGLDRAELAAATTGSVMGTTSGESAVIEALTDQWVRKGLENLDPALLRQVPASQIATAVNAELGLTGD